MAVNRFGPIAAVYPDGSPAIGAAYEVQNLDGSPATLYTTASGNVIAANPTAADGFGMIEFFAQEGVYRIVMTATDFELLAVVYPPDSAAPAELGEVFTQETPSATWTFNHSLGRLPTVSLYLMDGEEVDTDVEASTTQVTATWPSAQAGRMVLT
jgi:hypothetical protein